MTDREAWLLNEVSSMGRLKIDVEQYEELRKFALAQTKQLKRAKKWIGDRLYNDAQSVLRDPAQ